MLGVVARVVAARDVAGGGRRARQRGQVAAVHGCDIGPEQLVEMAVRGAIDDAVGILGRSEPGERVACRRRRPGDARQIVLPDRAVRPPVEAADVPVGAPERDNVG